MSEEILQKLVVRNRQVSGYDGIAIASGLEALNLRFEGWGLKVEGSGFGVEGRGLRVEGSWLSVER